MLVEAGHALPAVAVIMADEQGRRRGRGPPDAGLVGMPYDPMYTATKHAVVGFVRGAAQGLAAHGIRINALCPGFTDTPIVEDELRGQLPVPLMEPWFVAEAALRALNDAETGRAWIVQPNRIEPYRFAGVPGPR